MCMFNRCLCWRDFGRFLTAVGVVQLVVSTVDVILIIAVFAGVNQLIPGGLSFDASAQGYLDPALSSMFNTSIYILYIVLAVLDAFMILFSMLFLCGNEEIDTHRGRQCFYPWLLLFPFYAIYETAINIYFVVSVLSPQGQQGFTLAWAICPIVYWVLKHLFLGGSYYMIISHLCGCCQPHAVKVAEPTAVACHPQQVTTCHTTSPVYMAPAPVSSCNRCGASRPSCSCGQQHALPAVAPYGVYSAGNARSGWVSSIYNNGRNY